MILFCNFEELSALKAGALSLLDRGPGREATVAAPPEGRAEVEALLPRLDGDLSVNTLAEQRRILKGVAVIVECLKEEMDAAVLSMHPADEVAVAGYFLYGHALAVMGRLAEMGQEMEALIEVVTGAPATPEIAETFVFPS
jgi:hypothetical protein